MFPQLYANYWLERDEFDLEMPKRKRNSTDELRLFKALTLPQFISLLVQKKPPYLYGERASEEDIKRRMGNGTSQHHHNEEIEYELYDNIPCDEKRRGLHIWGKNMDKKKRHVLEMLKWSILPPHPVIIEPEKTKGK